MTKYQLWSRDEYGQGSILFTSEDLEEVVKEAKNAVTAVNVQNALTADDREKNWEAYMIMVGSTQKSRKHKRYVYAGSTVRDKGKVYGIKKDGSVESITLNDIPSKMVRVYLGDISTKRGEEIDWYAKDSRQRIIDTVDHPDLDAKTHFFVVKVNV